jgi:hypothetical protein
MSETYTSDAAGLRQAGRDLVESGKALPTAGDATTSSATDMATIRTHVEGRINDAGEDFGVSVRAAARALAQERAEANKLLQQMQEPATAIIEAAQGQVELAQAAIAEMQRNPDAALEVARQIEEATAAQAAENARLEALAAEVQRLQSEGAHGEAVAQAAAVMQGQVAAAHEAKGYLAALHGATISALQQKFPEFRGRDPTSTVAALQAVDPLRAEAFKNEFMLADAQYSREQARVGQLIQQAQAIHAQAQQQQLAQHQAWAEGEDRKFAAWVGGTLDPQVAKDSYEMLVTLGVPPENIARLWNEPIGFPLRDARAQVILAAAAKWFRAQANMEAERQKPAKPIPAVQRPGAARERADYAEAEVASLRNKAIETGALRDWANVRGEQLRQQRRRSGP